MDEMNLICINCGHAFKCHQQSTFELWYCDYEDSCPCNDFKQKRAAGTKDDPIEVQYDSESYRWN